MPTCKKCDIQFPSRAIIDGKERHLGKRSYCLDCSPFGANDGYSIRKENTRKLRENDTKTCPVCQESFKWTKNNVCPTCRKTYRRRTNKLKLVEFLGGKCERCDCSDHRCLQFHHRDPSEKSFNISLRLHCGIDFLRKEAEKCILLCGNCHLIEHSMEHEKLFEYYSKNKKDRPVKKDTRDPKVIKTKAIKICKDCPKIITNESERCKSCAGKKRKNKIEWPSVDRLVEMVKEKGYCGTGRLLGVSDQAVRKRIRNHS
jgi:hypothetical protein